MALLDCAINKKRCTVDGGRGICKFCTALGHSRAFDTHAVSYQNITTQKVLLEKKADWLICQGQE